MFNQLWRLLLRNLLMRKRSITTRKAVLRGALFLRVGKEWHATIWLTGGRGLSSSWRTVTQSTTSMCHVTVRTASMWCRPAAAWRPSTACRRCTGKHILPSLIPRGFARLTAGLQWLWMLARVYSQREPRDRFTLLSFTRLINLTVLLLQFNRRSYSLKLIYSKHY